MDTLVENIIIIGGGPAGLAAALYTSRANLKPLVFAGSPPGGQLTLTSEVENYPGFESILGTELITKFRTQVQKFGTRILDQNVLKLDFSKRPFSLSTLEASYKAQAIIIATGAKALWLNIESEQRLRGKGVSACATCDGFFFKNKVVAVVGGGDTAMEEALTLTKFASKVYVLHRRDAFRASKIMQDRVLAHPKIEVCWNTSVEEVLGDQKVTGLKLKKDGKDEDVMVEGLFLAIGHKPDTDLFKDHVELDKKGYILTTVMAALSTMDAGRQDIKLDRYNKMFQSSTSVEGVFAAGDCVDHVYRQAATAGGMGVGAALDAERFLETYGQRTQPGQKNAR